MSSERETAKAAFLQAHGYGDVRRENLGGDASTRSYERLHRDGGVSFIFMDQPPALESVVCPPDASDAERIALGYNAAARLAAGSVAAFVATAAYLRERGLSAPVILAHDIEAGLAILEDLGDGLYATLIAEGQDERLLYEAAVDLQIALHAETPPEILDAPGGVSWPLLTYDTLALKIATDTFLEWWPKFSGLPAFSDAAVADWDALWAPVWVRGEAGATVFTHRDYHCRNLMVYRDELHVIDFQDALLGPSTYDLASLLRDSYLLLEEALVDELVVEFHERTILPVIPSWSLARFVEDFHLTALQRNLKAWGRFRFFSLERGNDAYLRYIPTTIRQIKRFARFYNELDRVLTA